MQKHIWPKSSTSISPGQGSYDANKPKQLRSLPVRLTTFVPLIDQQKQEIPPTDAADVLADFLDRKNQPVSNSLGVVFKQAKRSKCNDAALEWSQNVSKIDENYLKAAGDIKNLYSVFNSKQRKMFQKAAEAYDKSCLGRENEIPDKFMDRKYKNVVAIVQANGVPFCGALRIRSNVFVTARHCFFHKRSLEGAPINAYQNAVHVSVLLDPKRKFLVRKIFGNASFDVKKPRVFSDREDYLFLKTASIDIEMPPISEKVPSFSEKLFLMGYFRFHDPAWIFGDPDKRGSRSAWWHGMRWTKAPLCRIGPVKDHCLSHFCQTDYGFSGSGMLARGTGSGIEYYGIHIGAMGIDNNSCSVDTESTAGNMGIRINLPKAAQTSSQNSLGQ